MAEPINSIDLAGEGLLPAWRTVIELCGVPGAREWTLVGGLMVDIHARRANIWMARPTDDVDVLVDIASNRSSLAEARAILWQMGFTLSANEQHAYRFIHEDGRKVDVMVADHLPSRMTPRLDRRPAFEATAGEQAIRRREIYRLTFDGGVAVDIGVPNVLGALVAKGAAWLVDRRDRTRHLDDAAVLLACIADASQLDFDGMSTNDRKRIGAIIEQLDGAHPSWISLTNDARSYGLFNRELIRRALTPRKR